ncbi:Xylanase inhibitor N-terminal [Arabidopsis suecica]|uniref:Xylanase inhibitor N-terminal n=1 Tax=Arabidopsis suecica TaxID=45249 RepID=A0A8T1XHS7_ARASU|nr:Xylanase inhibitor N-terminal [Arabidopsis suecica]
MALPSISSIGATVSILIYFFSLPYSITAGENILHQSPAVRSRRPMVFPLFLSQPNSSSRSMSIPHRKLHKSDSKSLPHSRMRLYDDLLINGYYTTRLWIGTPPQMFALIVDSGSTVTYVPCSDCEQCGKHQLTPQRAVFGCETVETGDLYSQRADGIIGLGQGDLSLVDQLVDKGLISNSFGLCYGGMDVGGGSMILGGFDYPSDMIFTDSDPDRSFGMATSLMGNMAPFLDSGTTYAYLPDAAFAAFEEAVMREVSPLKQIDGPDPNFKDTCFLVAASNDVSELSKIFPAVEMIFKSGKSWLLSPENYMFRHSKVHGAYCLGVFPNGKDHTTLLGGIVVRNTLVVYDRENSKVGFWRTNCSELSDRLHIDGAPPPATLPPNGSNPSRNSSSDVQEEIQVGQIDLDLQLTVNSSYLKPRIEELSKLLSKELEVKSSQVSLYRISPPKEMSLSSEWLLSLLNPLLGFRMAQQRIPVTNHQIKLPEIFGNYHLVNYKLEPSRKRTNKIIVAIAIGIIAVIIGLSAYGAWLIWKRKQTSIPYKPVDEAIVAEQELQPI